MTNVTSPPDTAAETAALEALADLLPRKKYVASLVTNAGRTCLCVSNRHPGALVEWIYCEGEHFFWSWGERIAAVADLEKAAEVISNVLRMIGPSS